MHQRENKEQRKKRVKEGEKLGQEEKSGNSEKQVNEVTINKEKKEDRKIEKDGVEN